MQPLFTPYVAACNFQDGSIYVCKNYAFSAGARRDFQSSIDSESIRGNFLVYSINFACNILQCL